VSTATAAPFITRHCRDNLHNWCTFPSVCKCSTCHQGPCAICAATNLQTMFDHPQDDDSRRICAKCYRAEVAKLPKVTTVCDECGAPGAFRNPSHKRNEFKCMTCHVKAGEKMMLVNSTAHLAAPCKGKDLRDLAHSWVHVRGTRFRCLCTADIYSAEMRDQLRREYQRSE